MKKINLILIAVLGIFAFSSCDDFLDVKPTNYGDSATAILTKADAESMITAVMNRMTSSNYYGRNLLLYADAKGGDMVVYSNGRGNDALYNFNHEYNSGAYGAFWSSGYDLILQLNTIINRSKAIQEAGAVDNFNDVYGQAYTLRALIYFEMIRLYGLPYTLHDPNTSLGLPLITEAIDIKAQPTRTTVKAIYDQIVLDLETAKDLISTSTKNGYVNYYGNRAIAARVYLTMGDYENALAAAEKVIDSGKFTLYTNEQWVESWQKQFGSESIFELFMNPNEGDLGTSSLGLYYSRYKHYSSSASGYYGASDAFIARLAEDPTDVRHGIMDFDEECDAYDKSVSQKYYKEGQYEKRMGSCYKYLGACDYWNTGIGTSSAHKSAGTPYRGDYGTFPGDGKDTDTAVNIKVIRLSEMYLIAAECALAAGDKDAAAEYLQAIRKRSPGLEPATADNVTLDMILNEKSKEFYGEGLRYWDMLRLGREITFNDEILGFVSAHRPQTIDTKTFYKVILPIPENELNANPKIQQNPEYSAPLR